MDNYRKWREGSTFTVVSRGVVGAASALLIMLGVFYYQMAKAGHAAPTSDEEKEQLRRISMAGVALGAVILFWSLMYFIFWLSQLQSNFSSNKTAAQAMRNWFPQLISATIASMLVAMSAPWVEPKEGTNVPNMSDMAITSMTFGALGAAAIVWVALCGCNKSLGESHSILCGPKLWTSLFGGEFFEL